MAALTGSTQPDFTANDKVPAYPSPFGYGSNMGYYPPWQDGQLADIAAGNAARNIKGVGVTTLRPAIFAHFLEQWGYDIRVDAFQHYAQLGVKDNVIFIGYPNQAQQDTTHYCPTYQSALFANMYTDIWDDGANGTPVNDENYYALFLYKMLMKYKDYGLVWEIWNEPDFDHSGNSLKPPGEPGSWWDNNPDPCDYDIHAPIFHYIRLLRISYEVIKTYSPDSYIAVGGIGFPSFLDALLRNTDHPVDGSVSDDFPLRGGAYFDMLSFHVYPHIDNSMRKWNNERGAFDYSRHSDAAAASVVSRKGEFEAVLQKYRYDGSDYPAKPYIITECNIPRKAFGEFIGSEEAQRNFLMKTLVKVQQADIKQFHVYQLGEMKPVQQANNEFFLMGLYENLPETQPYKQIPTGSGVAYKTMSDLLYGLRYDEQQTADLLLPDAVGGAAFVDTNNAPTYVLWAKTRRDQSELTTTQYTFPSILNVNSMTVKEWDFSAKPDSLIVEGARLQLLGSPVIVRTQSKPNSPSNSGGDEEQSALFRCFPNPYTDSVNIIFKLRKESKVNLAVYDLEGQAVHEFLQATTLPGGLHQYRFDQKVQPGLYLVKLQINDQEFTEKVVKVYGE